MTSSETTNDSSTVSCADAADTVNAWAGLAQATGELDDPLLVPGSFSPSSLLVALSPVGFSCSEAGDYPCGGAADLPPFEKLGIILPPMAQAVGTYETSQPPGGSDEPAVLSAETNGFPPGCGTEGSSAGWYEGTLELDAIDDTSVQGAFCHTLADGTVEAWTFVVDRC